MSKAFTREDDDAGFAPPRAVAPSRGHVTALGGRLAAERAASLATRLGREQDPGLRAALELEHARAQAIAGATVAPRPSELGVVSLGAEVHLRDEAGIERHVVIVSADEIGLVPRGASVASPVARTLLGARKGDVVEHDGAELFIVDVTFPG